MVVVFNNNGHSSPRSSEGSLARIFWDDKMEKARKIYNGTPLREREQLKEDLCRDLSVTMRTLTSWLRRIDEDTEIDVLPWLKPRDS